jgi:hypothetical protein
MPLMADTKLSDRLREVTGRVYFQDTGVIEEAAAELDRREARLTALEQALDLVEAVYRKNCVAPGEPSSVLAAIQAALKG